MLIPVLTFIAMNQAPPVYVPMANYDATNSLKELRITKIEGKYDAFVHKESDSSYCPGSRLSLAFTVKNIGRTPLKLPDMLVFQYNQPKPWMKTDTMLNEIPEQAPAGGGVRYLRGEERVVVAAGNTVTIHTDPISGAPIPRGPWNPMKVQARFGQRILDEYVWVGDEKVFEQALSLNVPNFYAVEGRGVFRRQGNQWIGAMVFRREGPAIGGPVLMQYAIYAAGTSTPVLMGGKSYELDAGEMFMTEEGTSARREFDIATARGEFTIKVGCPVHGMTTLLTDGNPSDNVLRSGSAVINTGGSSSSGI